MTIAPGEYILASDVLNIQTAAAAASTAAAASAATAATSASAASAAAAAAAASLAASIHSSLRAPSSSDDISHGYDINAMWNSPAGVLTQKRNLTNAALWIQAGVMDGVLPGDVVLASGAAPYMAFGMRRVIDAYGTGPCIEVERTSDAITGSISGTTLSVVSAIGGTIGIGQCVVGTGVATATYIVALGTGTGGVGTYTVNNAQTVASTALHVSAKINFLPDGSLDVSSLVAYLRNNVGRIGRQYDQTGNGRHKVQDAWGYRPLVDVRTTIGKSISIVYDTQINGNGSLSGQYTYDTPKTLGFPTGLSLSSQNFGMVFAGRARSAQKPSCFWVLNNSSGSPANALSFANQYPPGSGTQVGLNCYFEASAQSFNSYQIAMSSPFVGGVSASSGGVYTFAGDVGLQTSGNPSITLGGYGGLTGGVGNSEFGYCEMADEIWWPNYLTFDDIANVSAAMYRGLGLAPQTRDYLIMDGDSITEGSGATGNRNLPRLTELLLKHPVKMVNTGFAGDTLSGRSGFFPYFIGTITPTNPPNKIIHIAAGSNDIAHGATAATTYSAAQSYCAQARAAGWKVIVATVLPRSDVTGAAEAIRVAYNSTLRSGWASFADGLADWAGDYDMGASTYPSNSALCADGIHPTSTGYAYLAQISSAAINKIMS